MIKLAPELVQMQSQGMRAFINHTRVVGRDLGWNSLTHLMTTSERKLSRGWGVGAQAALSANQIFSFCWNQENQ